jgi:type IV secretion system protein VirB1
MFDVSPYVECLFQVHPDTATQIINHESGGHPNAINVNAMHGKPRPVYTQPKKRQDAVTLAKRFIQQGYTVDMGLMQINSNNLQPYGVTTEEIFDPCINIRIGSRILYNAYQRTILTTPDPQNALLKALSVYNTGDMRRGFANGYVARYTVHNTQLPAHNSTVIDMGDLYDD